MIHRTRFAATPAVLLLLLGSAAASAQTWEYRSYRKDVGGNYNKDKYVTGTISLEEKDGQAYFRMIAGTLDTCYRQALPAAVSKTAETLTIEVTQPVSGCDEFRYVINNDGSGGIKETKRGDRWVKSKFDHGLTPAK